MKLYQYIIIGVTTLTLTACDDFLTVTPKNTQTTDNFYKTEAQMDQALTGLYGTLKPIPKYLFAMSELRSDNTWVLTDSKQNDYSDVATFNANGLLTDNIVSGCWSDYYKIVSAANTFLDKIGERDFNDASTQKQYMAEARCIRALAYFDLVRFFGRVPAPTHILTTNESFELGQSEAIDVYTNIIVPDLQYAVENLAESATDYQGKLHNERLTQVAAKGFLGKVYMTMAGFPINDTAKKAEAQKLFKEVIDYANTHNKYWMPDMDTWNQSWLHENDNKNSIFEIQYIAESGQGNPMVALSVPSNPGTDWCGNNLVTGTRVYIERGLQKHFIEKKQDSNEYLDQRAGGTLNLKETVDEDGNIITSKGNTFYVKYFESKVKRAKLGKTDMDASIVDRTYWPQNFQLLRIEDIMLLYAECVGNTAEGREMVNRIRRRAGLTDIETSLSEADFQKAVQDERRYELAEEGMRWFDLIRRNEYVNTIKQMFNDNDDTVNGTYKQYASRVTADMYLYPIPQSQIEVRKGLYTQNKGY